MECGTRTGGACPGTQRPRLAAHLCFLFSRHQRNLARSL